MLVALVLVFSVPFLAPEGARAAFLGPHSDEPSAIAKVAADEHLGDWPPVRFVRFVVGVLHFDFGRSYVEPVDVERDVLRHVWLTALLVAAAVALRRGRGSGGLVFLVLASEAVLRLPGLGRVLASAIDVRDIALIRAVLLFALVAAVLLPWRPAPPRRAARGAVLRGAATLAWSWLFVLAVAVAFVRRLPLDNPNALYVARAAPSLHHWLGTDDVGHDVVARVVWGAQGTLLLVLVATIAGFLIGAVIGTVAAETATARKAYAWLGGLAVPALGVSVALAAVLPREPAVFWEWLVPVTVAGGVHAGTRAFGGSLPDLDLLKATAVAALDASAAAFTAEAVLGALGAVPEGTLSWGALLDDVRQADSRRWLELVTVVVVVSGTVIALRVAAASLTKRARGVAAGGDAAGMLV